MARERGARVLLRIEDHDWERCRAEYEADILADLDWLGFVPDVFPIDFYRVGTCERRQSDRGELYHDAGAQRDFSTPASARGERSLEDTTGGAVTAACR